MRKFLKLKAPDYLKLNWKPWGLQWKWRYKNPALNNTFNWRCDTDDLIKNYLASVTDSHCSFCDGDNINIGSAATIEHFKPKSKFFRVSYHYNNLYNCCSECQKKKDRYNKLLLKPDLPSYHFENYFEIELLTGKLKPNPNANDFDRERAKITIDLYRLNHGERPKLRLNALKDYLEERNNSINPNIININKYSYRFFIEEYLRIT